MKKIVKIIFSFLSFLILYGCTGNTAEDIRIENIEASKIRSSFLEETLIDIESEGIYIVNTSKDEYIIFNGVKSEYKDVEVVVKDEVLQIIFEKIDSNESAKQLYEIMPYPTEQFDTIQLIENGKETHFEAGYSGD